VPNSAKIGLANSDFEMQIVDGLFQVTSMGVGYAVPLAKFRKALRRASAVLAIHDNQPSNVVSFCVGCDREPKH